MDTTNLELYVMDGCPFCRRVLQHVDGLGIELPIRNISSDPDARAYLIDKGGKLQVPCLFIDGNPLYESGDIIKWLDAHLA
jgi:glutaredoxin 3